MVILIVIHIVIIYYQSQY